MLVGVLAYDRAHLLDRCLDSLTRHAGADYTLVIHRDGDDPEVGAVVKRYADRAIVIEPFRRVGITAGLNDILKHRAPGEDFVRVDGDVFFLTHGWLRLLADGRKDYGLLAPIWTGNTWQDTVWDFLKGFHRPSHIDCDGSPLGGVVFHPGEVMDKLGGYRNHGRFYGCQERDYAARVRGLGLKIGYLTSVLIEHPRIPPLKGDRRAETEDALKAFKRKRSDYEAGLDLYEAVI